MSNKGLRFVFFVVSAVFMVFCAQVAFAQSTTVKWLTVMAVVDEAFHRAVVEEFNDSQQRIEVEMELIANDTLQREQIVLRVAAGTPPDVVDVNPMFFYQLVKDGILEEIERYLAPYPAFQLDDFYPAVLDSLRVDGKLYGVSQRISIYHLFYNADMFNAAGLTPPSASWSDPRWDWAAFREAAGKLSQDVNGDGTLEVVGASVSNALEYMLPFVWQAGGRLFSEDYSRLALNSNEALAAVEYLADGRRRGIFQSRGVDQFIARTAAMHADIPPRLIALRSQADFNWDVAAFPMGPAGSATVIQPIPYGIVASSPNKEEAAEFLRFLFSVDMSRRQSEQGIIVQPRRSVVSSDAFIPDPPPANKETIIEALAVARPIPNLNVKYPEIREVIQDALTPVWEGRMDARVAIAGIEGQVSALLAEGR